MPEREHLKETLDRLRAAKELPAGLDAYRARLLRRLEAQNAFFDSLAAAKKSEKPEDLLAGTRSYVDARKLPEYQAKVTNLASKQPIGKWTTESSGQIADFYSGAIEAHPEEEFHRAIQRIGVHYNCDFDEG